MVEAPAGELSNLRDFGGFATGDGRRMVQGRLYRSEHTHGLSQHGVERLKALGIRSLIDLRGSQERAAFLPVDADGIAVHSTPVEPRTAARLVALKERGELTRDRVHALMVLSYREYVREAAAQFGQAITRIVHAASEPLLLHCTAGKDRTGFIVAVIQSALGVDNDAIFRHYLLTNERLHRGRLVGHVEADGDVNEPVLLAHAEYLAAAFEEIQLQHGDARGFIRAATAGAVTPADLQVFLLPTESGT